MTNPDNIVRVRARNGGRASVYEANGWAQAYTSGLLEGNGVTQNTSADMNVLVGGSATKPDVVLAINPADYRIGLDIVGQQAIAITAPASNSRISAIVAYTDDLSLATTEDTVTGSPSSCGLIVVNGTASASPSEPTDNQIRTAITADGATGSQASYCIIATILVESTTTTITDSMITIKRAQIGSQNIDFTTFDSGWKKITLPSTMTEEGSLTRGLWYRNMNGIVHLYGQVKKSSGSFSQGETIAVLPEEAMLYFNPDQPNESQPLIGATAGGVLVRVSVYNNNNTISYNADNSTGWIFFELSYKAKNS